MRRTKVTNRAGLTLIELVVAMSAGCIVFLATAAMLFFGQKSLNHGWQQANLQRDASYAMLKIRQSIRCGNKADLEGDGEGLKIYHNATWIRFWFVPAQNNLQYQLEGEQEQILLDGVVENATFEVDPNTHRTVTVDLELRNGNCEAHFLSTAMMRNYEAGT
jgi:prepilin-type N-terminal cleavage/methylation domain-containing protein